MISADLFSCFINYLHDGNVSYAILGDVRLYPEHIQSDVDLIIEPLSFQRLPELLLEFCQQQQIFITQLIRHEASAYHVVLVRPDGPHFLQLDIHAEFGFWGRSFLNASSLLAQRQKHPAHFFIPSPEKAFIYYLLKQVHKQAIGPQKWAYLQSTFQADQAAAASELGPFFPRALASDLVASLEHNDLSRFQALLPAAKKALAFKGLSLQSIFRESLRLLQRIRYPTGLWIAFWGSDGSGKTTLSTALASLLKPVFPDVRRYHLRPHLFEKRHHGVVSNPHQHPARGQLGSLIKLAYWGLDYSLGFFLQTLPQLQHSCLILYDRYYHDLLADPKRYRYGASLRFARALGYLLPKPDLCFVLVAAPEIIQTRKQEVSLEETRKQQLAYQGLAETLKAYLIDVSGDSSSALRQIETIVLKHLQKRSAKRLGWRYDT
jgi:thymidylate kinase